MDVMKHKDIAILVEVDLNTDFRLDESFILREWRENEFTRKYSGALKWKLLLFIKFIFTSDAHLKPSYTRFKVHFDDIGKDASRKQNQYGVTIPLLD